MPSGKTEITEIVTGLAMLGYQSIDRSLEVRPRHIAHVDEPVFDRLDEARASGKFDIEFETAWSNGTAFARSNLGLRGRPPWSIEWKGHHRPASKAIETIPADLRIDHVYLVSCKYGSRILHNSGPFPLFDHCLAPTSGVRRASWFEEVSPDSFRAVWEPIARSVRLPGDVTPNTATQQQRAQLSNAAEALDISNADYVEFVRDCSIRTAARWMRNVRGLSARSEMFWRMMRMQSAPYFVLGARHDGRPTRYRVDTPWDFSRMFEVESFTITPGKRGQVSVDWDAGIRHRDGEQRSVRGHVEVRWSHGKLTGPPEAKVYLDSDPEQVPGYTPL